MLFLDTTVLVGAADARDENHEDGKAILQAIATGKPGMAWTSDYVLDETLTILAGKRGIGADKAVTFVHRVMSSPRVKVLSADSDDFRAALERFPDLGDRGLSFTDTMSTVLMDGQNCSIICSHDEGFDKLHGIERRQTL